MHHREPARKRWALGISGAALGAALLALAAWGALPPPPIATTRLADGSLVQLRAVTFGSQTRVHGSFWQRLLYAVLPQPLKERAGCSLYQGSASQLTFWVRRRGGQPLGAGAMFEQPAAVVFNELGDELPPSGWNGDTAGYEGSWSFDNFPRRGRLVGVRLYGGADGGVRWRLLGEITAPNPAPGPYPVWAAPRLPITGRSGDLAVTLSRLSIEPGGSTEEPALPGNLDLARWHADLSAVQAGSPAEGWHVSEYRLSDATGNVCEPSSWSVEEFRRGKARWAFFAGPRCPSESAWKLRMRFDRSRSTPRADEVWTVRDLPVPRRGQSLPLTHHLKRHGLEVEIDGVAGAGTSPPGWSFHEKKPSLSFRFRSRSLGECRLLRVTDERGRAVGVENGGSGGDESEERVLSDLDLPPGAHRLTATFAVSASRYVELLVPAPTPLTPPKRGK